MIRLFLSVDLAGSTLYKTTAGDDWLQVFHRFFSRFPIMLTGQAAFEFAEEDTLPEVSVWKFMGDEAIFVAPVLRAEDVARLVRAHYRAMERYEADYLAELPLRLKGTAWLAGFPDPNIEIEIPELGGRQGTAHTDFIGPDIDLGFRITKFAAPSIVAASLDLAEVVLNADNSEALDFFLLGREALKGVHFGRPYPILWTAPAGMTPKFTPWDSEDNPLVAKALAQGPATAGQLRGTIETSRAFLRKMHGVKERRLTF